MLQITITILQMSYFCVRSTCKFTCKIVIVICNILKILIFFKISLFLSPLLIHGSISHSSPHSTTIRLEQSTTRQAHQSIPVIMNEENNQEDPPPELDNEDDTIVAPVGMSLRLALNRTNREHRHDALTPARRNEATEHFEFAETLVEVAFNFYLFANRQNIWAFMYQSLGLHEAATVVTRIANLAFDAFRHFYQWANVHLAIFEDLIFFVQEERQPHRYGPIVNVTFDEYDDNKARNWVGFRVDQLGLLYLHLRLHDNIPIVGTRQTRFTGVELLLYFLCIVAFHQGATRPNPLFIKIATTLTLLVFKANSTAVLSFECIETRVAQGGDYKMA